MYFYKRSEKGILVITLHKLKKKIQQKILMSEHTKRSFNALITIIKVCVTVPRHSFVTSPLVVILATQLLLTQCTPTDGTSAENLQLGCKLATRPPEGLNCTRYADKSFTASAFTSQISSLESLRKIILSQECTHA